MKLLLMEPPLHNLSLAASGAPPSPSVNAAGLDPRALEISDPSVAIFLVAPDLGIITEHGLGKPATRVLLWAGCLPSLSLSLSALTGQ